jgi:hypothetical protein
MSSLNHSTPFDPENPDFSSLETVFQSSKNGRDQVLDSALRPQTFDEYVGQEVIKQNLHVLLTAARERNHQPPARPKLAHHRRDTHRPRQRRQERAECRAEQSRIHDEVLALNQGYRKGFGKRKPKK